MCARFADLKQPTRGADLPTMRRRWNWFDLLIVVLVLSTVASIITPKLAM